MDPFSHLSEDISHLILQHIDGETVLSSMLVSPRWNKIVIDSRRCMSKIKLALKFRDRPRTKVEELREVKKLIHETTRCYQAIELDFNEMPKYNDELCHLLFIFMKKAEEYLTDLIINGLDCRPPKGKLDLSKIQLLHMIDVRIPVRYQLLETATSLKTLKIEIRNPDCSTTRPTKRNMRYLRDFMRKSSTLERFEILGALQFSSLCLHTFWDRTNFQLKSFKIENKLTPKIPEHFINFMANQSKSLESFWYDGTAVEAIVFAFNQLPVLTHLSVDDSLLGGVLNLPPGSLNTNETLSVLEIPNFDHHLGAENILKLTPNLTRLFLHYINHGVMEYAARNLRKLKFLKFCIDPYTDQNNCSIFYNRLKEEDLSVNQDILLIRENWCQVTYRPIALPNSLPFVFDLEL